MKLRGRSNPKLVTKHNSMLSVGFERVSKNARVGFVANPLIVAFRETKVLPSACASVQDLAGSPATVETYTSIQRFHSPRLDQKSREQIANQFRWPPLEIRDAVSGVHKAPSGLKLHGGTCHWLFRFLLTALQSGIVVRSTCSLSRTLDSNACNDNTWVFRHTIHTSKGLHRKPKFIGEFMPK